MKKWINRLEQWGNSFRKFLRPVKSKKPVHTIEDDDLEIHWEEEKIITPDQYFVSRTGQMMREPVKPKKRIKRYKVKK